MPSCRIGSATRAGHLPAACSATLGLRSPGVTQAASSICQVSPTRCQARTRLSPAGPPIIAVPTLITGYFGMNVPYPGFSDKAGFTASLAAMILAALVLYIVFKRKDWP